VKLYTTKTIEVYHSDDRRRWAELRRSTAIVEANPGKGEWDVWGAPYHEYPEKMWCFGEGYTLDEAKRRAEELLDR